MLVSPLLFMSSNKLLAKILQCDTFTLNNMFGVIVAKCSKVQIQKQGGSDAEVQQDVTGQIQG